MDIGTYRTNFDQCDRIIKPRDRNDVRSAGGFKGFLHVWGNARFDAQQNTCHQGGNTIIEEELRFLLIL